MSTVKQEGFPVTPTDSPEVLLVSPQDAARLVSLSRSNVYKLIKAGELPSVKIGGLVRVSVPALRAWIARQTTGGQDNANA